MDSSDLVSGQRPGLNKISANDLVGKMMQAHSSQRLGNVLQALEIYKEVIALDPNGACGRSAKEAVSEINANSITSELLLPADTDRNPPENARGHEPNQKQKLLLLKWFLDLSITKKYLLILVSSEILFLALAGVGSQLIRNGLKTQLFNQAKSELAVSELNYNLKINQMVVGFQAQSDNPAIINLAKTPPQGRNSIAYFELQNQVKQLLKNQLNTLKIEYSTLVGKDLRIIASANSQRQGEIFNPNNLVTEVFNDPKQIKASEVINSAELVKEGSTLPFNFGSQEALIRYTVTPVKEPATLAVVGALISGDIVNGKPLIPQETVKAFGTGYSAIYSRESIGEFILASAFTKARVSDSPRLNDPLPPSSLISAAAVANGELVTDEIELNGQTYAMAAKSLPTTFKKVANGWLPGYSAHPVAILVRGIPSSEINDLVGDSLNKLACSSVVLISATVLLSLQLGRLITKPISHLQSITKSFSQGERGARAEVFGRDEVGQLAIAFNQMADNILTSEVALREQDRAGIRLIEQARLHETQNKLQLESREKQAQRIIDFLLEVEAVKAGDLTTQASVSGDEIGSIADAFNATINYWRQIIVDAQAIAKEAENIIETNGNSLLEVSKVISTYDREIVQIQELVKKIRRSTPDLLQSAQDAATLAEQALAGSQQNIIIINESVVGLEKIKIAIGDTVKTAICLYNSCQESDKVIQIISNISEKINILALNASIEAVKTGGDNSEGLRLIADEIRSFSEQLASSSKTIENIGNSLQKQSGDVLSTIKTGESQVDLELALIDKANPHLQKLPEVTHAIISCLYTIAVEAQSQLDISQQDQRTLERIESILKANNFAQQQNLNILQSLSKHIKTLQILFSHFKV